MRNTSPIFDLLSHLLLIFLASNLVAQSSLSPLPHSPIIPLKSVQWNAESFWGDRGSSVLAGLKSTMNPLMLGNERSQFVANFRIASGKQTGRHRGPAWNDGDCYKWIEALSAFYAQNNDASIRELLSDVIQEIAAAQRSDGYIHTPTLIQQRNSQEARGELQDPANFEMYNMGHLMTAACVHFEATGDDSLLQVARKAADYLDKRFANPDVAVARHAICPAHYMGAIDLYRTTGEARYLELCKRWLAMRDLVTGGGDDNQDRIPFLQQREAVGHAVRANYLYAGVTDLFLETKRTELLEPLNACWNSVHQRKIYVTGGCGALYDGASPDGSEKQSSITRVHQAYGRNFQLPNSTAHNETCAAIGNVLWNHRMFLATGDAKYIDALETSLYNAVLAGVSLDGQRFFYTNTLRQLDAMPTDLRWPRERQSWISCYCCPPNVARIVAQIGRYAYKVDDSSTQVLIYGSNRLKQQLNDGRSIEIQQTSDYPLQGSVNLQIVQAPSEIYTIGLRIPAWCSRASIKVNSKLVSDSNPQGSNSDPKGTFVSLSRQWRSGDQIELQLEMPIQLLEAHPLVEECRGQVAVRRGPIVYCLESTDIPAGKSVQSACIDPDLAKAWKVQEDANDKFTSKLPVIEGSILAGEMKSDPARESNSLYRSFESKRLDVINIRLVPYFAWGNRGHSEMTVWMPVKP